MPLAVILAALLLTPADPPPVAAPGPLALVCTGDGERRARQESPFTEPNAGFSGEAALTLDAAGAARLSLPEPLIPRLHGAARDGAWPVKDLQVSKAEIRGTVSFNPFDKAHVIIDLGLGVITLDDNLGRFVGRCRPADPAPQG